MKSTRSGPSRLLVGLRASALPAILSQQVGKEEGWQGERKMEQEKILLFQFGWLLPSRLQNSGKVCLLGLLCPPQRQGGEEEE